MFDDLIAQRNQTVILHGSGPAMHVTAHGPSKMIVVTKSKATPVTLSDHTDIEFAA